MLTVKHAFVNPVVDDPDAAAAGEVVPSQWNAAHVVTGTIDQTLLTIKDFGAVCDGVTDDTAAITASLAALNYALIPPNVSVGVGSTIVVGSNQALLGFGFSSVLVPLNDFFNQFFIELGTSASTNVTLANFQITSTRTTAIDFVGFIQNQFAISQLRINGVGLNAPNHNKAYVALIATGENVSDVVIQNCDIQAGGGMVIFATPFGGTASDILITNNIISNCLSGSNTGIAISLSAQIRNCEVSNNIIGNVEYACVEIVGPQTNVNICNNVFWGTGPRGFSCTNAQNSSNVIVQGNVTDASSAHFWEVASCPGVVICNNTIYGNMIVDCINAWIHHNTIVSVTTAAGNGGIGLGNGIATVTGCLVENNTIDGSAGLSSSPSLLYCNGAAVTGNILRNNLLKLSPQPGTYTGQFNGATNNRFSGNLFENAGDNTVGDPVTIAGNGASSHSLINTNSGSNGVAVLQNTSSNGYSSIDFHDNAGTQQVGFGYGNSGSSFGGKAFLDVTGTFVAQTAGKERLRLDSGGTAIFNISSTPQGLVTPIGGLQDVAQFHGSQFSPGSNIGFYSFGASNWNPVFNFYYTASTVSSNTHQAVQSGFGLGGIGFIGSDGTNWQNAASVFADADGNFSSGSAPGRLLFATTPSGSGTLLERLRIDSKGTVNIGNNAAAFPTVFGDTPSLQISTNTQALDLRRYSADAFGAYMTFNKSRSGSIGTNTAVSSGDALGEMHFCGYDATGTPALREAAVIYGFADAAPTAGSVPGRLSFWTSASGSGSATERLRIDSKGNVTLGTAALATSATDGFLYLDSMAGAPSGTPTSYTGRVPLTVDTTNNKLMGYYGGAWNSLTGAGGGSGSPGGSSTDVQFNSAGSFGGDSGFTYAGSGVATLTVSLTDPLIIGGTIASSTLTLESTSGVGTSDAIIFKTGSQVEAARIDSASHVIIGGAASQISGSLLQLVNANNSNGSPDLSLISYSASDNQADLNFYFSQSNTIGTQTAVSAGNDLALINFFGSDGTAFQLGAQIGAVADGAFSAGSAPTRLTFGTTPSGSATSAERLRIDSKGGVNIGNKAGQFTNVWTDQVALQISTTQGALDLRRYGGNEPYISTAKSNSSTIGANTTVTSGQPLFAIYVGAYDATGTPALQQSASIVATADAAPTAGSVAGRWVFATAASGSGSPTERLRIDAAGLITVAASGSLKVAAGTATVSPLTFQSGTNLTTAAVGAAEFDGSCFYKTAIASARQVVDCEQVQALSGGRTLTANTSAQAIFNATANGAITLAASTSYEFELEFTITGLSGSTHTLSLGFGGTATLTSIAYSALAASNATSAATQTAGNLSFVAVATATTIQASGVNTIIVAKVRGIVRVNAGGTFIPQVTQGTASAAGVVQTNSFFRCWPVGSNVVTNVGNWS